MKVPPAGHDVGKRWAAHERGVVPRAAQSLRDSASEEHHVVGGGERIGHVKHRLNLARTQFNFERQQRQAQGLRGVLNDAQRLVTTVRQGVRQQVVAGVHHLNVWRQPRPRGQIRVKWIVPALDPVNVQFHFKPAPHGKALPFKLRQGALQDATCVQQHGGAVLKPGLALQPAGLGRPGQQLEAGRVRQQKQVAGGFETGQVGHAPRFEDLPGGSIRGIFKHQRADHSDAVAHGFGGGSGHQGFAAQHAMQVAP